MTGPGVKLKPDPDHRVRLLRRDGTVDVPVIEPRCRVQS
jgi:hypothetical protein